MRTTTGGREPPPAEEPAPAPEIKEPPLDRSIFPIRLAYLPEYWVGELEPELVTITFEDYLEQYRQVSNLAGGSGLKKLNCVYHRLAKSCDPPTYAEEEKVDRN